MNTSAPDFMNIPSTVTNYVNEFNKYSNNTIENFLNMCNIVIIAKHKLQWKEDFKQFCKDIGHGSSSAASISKMLKIGEHYSILYENRDKLPSAWTTLYALACLPQDILERSLKNSVINSRIDGKAAKALMPPKTKCVPASLNNFLTEPKSESEQSETTVHACETDATTDATTDITAQTPLISTSTPIITQSTLEVVIEGEMTDQIQEQLLSDFVTACARMGFNVVNFEAR